ncbi:MAG TPA: OmpA family protein [Polyangiaceae bacterium]|nr:OmpA family protein [Polyangiaceae bacterium]
MSFRLRRVVLARVGFVVAAWGLVGCGHSEEEWQAQLDKYNKLSGEYSSEKDAHKKTGDELAATQKKVADLRKQLEQMGVNLDALSTQVNQTATEKQQLSQSLEELQAALDEYKRRAEQLEKIKARFDELQKKLAKLTDLGIKVEIRHNRMVIRLPGDVLFGSGSDQLSKDGEKYVAAVADVIRKDSLLKTRYFQVAGHTDNKPLAGGKFGDNWGLSAMRARAVLLFLVKPEKDKGGGLDVSKLHAAGYGDTDPIAPNTTPENLKQNRRVELVLLPDVSEMLDLKSI